MERKELISFAGSDRFDSSPSSQGTHSRSPINTACILDRLGAPCDPILTQVDGPFFLPLPPPSPRRLLGSSLSSLLPPNSRSTRIERGATSPSVGSGITWGRRVVRQGEARRGISRGQREEFGVAGFEKRE